MEKTGFQGDIAIADGQSPDGTARIVQEYMQKHSNIFLIDRGGKTELGAAYKLAFNKLLPQDYDVFIQMDADLSHHPEELPHILKQLVNDHADLVIGSRYTPSGAIEGWPLKRKLVSRGANFLARHVLNLPNRDVTSGYRGWRTDFLKKIDLEKISADGYVFMLEMLCAARRLEGKIQETPITFTERRQGESKLDLRNIIEYFFLVWRLKLKFIREDAVLHMRQLLHRSRR